MRLYMLRSVLLLMMLALPMVMQAQDYGQKVADASVRLAEIKASNSTIIGINADFVSTKSMAMMTDVQKSVGTMSYRRQGDRLELVYTQPAGNSIVIEGESISMTTAGKTVSMTAGQNPAVSQMLTMVKSCVTGDFVRLSEKATVNYYQSADLFTMVIVPQSGRVRRYIGQIVLRFNADNSLRVMQMTEGSGDRTEYVYSNQKISR